MAALAVVLACCLAPPPVAGIIGNSVFESVRNVTESFAYRHDAMFERFLNCTNNDTRVDYAQRGKPQKLYIVQDGSGGGGIGNLILKIK